jgi:hypothetical protein
MRTSTLPDEALLDRYRRMPGAYTDCYSLDIARTATLAEFIEAFYTGRLFRGERLVLRLLVAKPSTDDDVRRLASGERDTFAAWSVEARASGQILLCDYQNKTRSWLMVAPLAGANGAATRLYFGSAIVPRRSRRTGQLTLGAFFHALLGFHQIYSRLLIRSAARRLARQRSN